MKVPMSFLSLLVAASLCACTKSETAAAQTRPAESRAVRSITILGDKTRFGVIDRIAAGTGAHAESENGVIRVKCDVSGLRVEFNTATTDDVPLKARLAANAGCAILALNASDGPMPVHREDILLARQMAVTSVVTVLTRTDLVDDPELLDLEELEGRELLNKYLMNGDSATFLVDTPKATKGRKLATQAKAFSTAKDLVDCSNERSAAKPTQTVKVATAAFYVLTSQELFLRGVNKPPEDGVYEVLVADQRDSAAVRFDSNVTFGGNLDGTISFGATVSASKGQRFVVLRDGHIAAAGVITSISSSNRN